MKRILLLLTLVSFVNVALAQSINTNKKEVKIEQKCPSTEKSLEKVDKKEVKKSANKGCCSKNATEKKCASTEKNCSNSSKKTACSKNKKVDNSKCSKKDACCTNTGKKRADCDKKDKACCAGA